MVCHLTASPGKPLKRCSRCHAIYYCSAEHQKRHWKTHRPLCTHLSSAALAADQENFFTGAAGTSLKEWALFRKNAVQTAEVILGRSLELFEQDMFLFPRTCRASNCHLSTGDLLDCVKCYAVTYCSHQHREEGEEQHRKVCRQLRLCRLLDRHESQMGIGFPPIPPGVDPKYLPPAPDISHYVEQPWTSAESILAEERDWAFLTNQLSGPLTILKQADRFLPSLSTTEELVVHVVGASIIEMMGLIKWEYLAHRLPALKSLTYVFIGPELEEEDDEGGPKVLPCSACQDNGVLIEYVVHAGTYKSYLATQPKLQPNILLAQNCGFSEHQKSSVEWEEGWASLDCLLQHSAPVIFTSYTKEEAEQDLTRLLETVEREVEVLARCEENSMRSQRPLRDWEGVGGDLYYSNNFLSVVVSKKM